MFGLTLHPLPAPGHHCLYLLSGVLASWLDFQFDSSKQGKPRDKEYINVTLAWKSIVYLACSLWELCNRRALVQCKMKVP